LTIYRSINVIAKVDAAVLTVIDGVTLSGIDAVLANAGSLSGTITSDGGSPLEGAAVSIYGTPTPGSPVKIALTVTDGTYSMVGVAPGDYFVRISHPDYFAEWYNNVPDYTTATIVTVTAGVDSVVNAALAPGGAISGVVTDDGGQPVAGILIDIYEAEGVLKYQRITLADGSYDVPGMVAGTYAIFANADSGTPGAYRDEWWDDLAPGTPYASVGKITVAAGTDDTVNFILNRSVVSGTVTSAADSLPIQGVVVTLLDSLSAQVRQTTTDAAGTYAFEAFGFSNSPLSVSFEATSVFFVDGASAPFGFSGGDKQVEDAVLAVDQQPPTIDAGQSFTIPENIAVSAIVGTVSGGDNNRADTVTWSITGGNSDGLFTVDAATGAIKTTAALDYETTNAYSLTVAISDGSAQDSTNIAITVTDVDETIPSAGFTDTIGTLFEKSIDWMAFTGITAGCNPPDNDLYCPSATVTRGQMAAFLVRALNLPAASENYFTDDDNSIFEDSINRVAQAGITRGCNPPGTTCFVRAAQ
jgi:Cadherin domain/Carboxypeptidase regulatory-like domain